MFVKRCELEWMQVIAILSAALVSLNTALLYAWPAPSIPMLLSGEYLYNITMDQASYTTIIPSLASVASSPFYPYLMDRFGRKRALLSVAAPQFLSWILIAQASDITTVYISRALSGFTSTCLYVALPVYIGEISTPRIRGLWGNAMSWCGYFGVCLMNIVGSMCAVRTTAAIFTLIPITFFILFVFMPETPYFYMMQGDENRAYDSLKRLRHDHTFIEKEFANIRIGVQEQMVDKLTMYELIRLKSNREALLICAVVRGVQQFAGISAFAVYAPFLFKQAHGRINENYSAIIYTAALMIFSCVGSISLDVLGRRYAMLISSLGCATVLLVQAGYFYFLKDYLSGFNIELPYFSIIGMLTYVLVYSLGLGIVPNLMLAELFPSNVKGNALCLLNIIFGMYSSISTKMFQVLYSSYGMHAPLFIFGLCCLLGMVLSIYLVPETSGKTLEEIQFDLRGTNQEPNSD